MSATAESTEPVVVPNRCFTGRERDPDAPDAVWVCVRAADYDAAGGPEARAAAIRYVTDKHGPNSGSDRQDGPHPDPDGKVKPYITGPTAAHEGVFTPDQYRALAAQQGQVKGGNKGPYACFFRVRRADAVA